MAQYNFRNLRPYDRERSEALQERISRYLFPYDMLDPGRDPGGARSGRFIIGQNVRALNPGGGPLPTPTGDDDDDATGTTPQPGRIGVFSSHYGGATYGFHFMGATTGGGGNNEIRVSPYIEAEHIETKALWIVPYSGVTAGQFIELRRSTDDNIVNTALPTGSLIGPYIGRVGSNPTPDNERAIAVPAEATLIDTFRHGWSGGSYLKVRLYYTSPAVALPVISVILSVTYRTAAGNFLFAVRS